jgi:hypothetical protein
MQLCYFSPKLEVNGGNQVWVEGKYAQISSFLKRTRTWFWVWGKLSPFLQGIILGSISNLFFFWLVYQIYEKSMLGVMSATIGLVCWIVITMLILKDKLLRHSQIIIFPKKSFFTKENIGILIAFLAMITGIVASIIIPLIKMIKNP